MFDNPLRRFKFYKNELVTDKFTCSQIKEQEKLLHLNGEELDCANVNVENIFPDDDLTNIIISVEGVELHVHKETMCSLSPVFMAMLCGNFVESKNRRIELPGKNAADVILFLSFFYPPRKFPLKDKIDFFSLLSLCEEYQTEWLKKDIIKHFCRRLTIMNQDECFNKDPKVCFKDFKHRYADYQRTSSDTQSYNDSLIVYFMFLAEQFNIPMLIDTCKNYVFELKFVHVKRIKFFEMLSVESKMIIYKYCIKRAILSQRHKLGEQESMDELAELAEMKPRCVCLSSSPKRKKTNK